MSWWNDFLNGVMDFLERLGSKKNVDTIEGLLRLVLLAAELFERFNAPLSGAEKREMVRAMLRLVKYSTETELAELSKIMIETKKAGGVENLQSFEMDKIIGDGVAFFISSKWKNIEPADESGLKGIY